MKEKFKQLEVTIMQQMEEILRQQIEIEKLAQNMTKQVAQEGAQEGVRQEVLQGEARQELEQVDPR